MAAGIWNWSRFKRLSIEMEGNQKSNTAEGKFEGPVGSRDGTGIDVSADAGDGEQVEGERRKSPHRASIHVAVPRALEHKMFLSTAAVRASQRCSQHQSTAFQWLYCRAYEPRDRET